MPGAPSPAGATAADPAANPPAHDALVPIRLDLTVDNRHVHDSFLWNVHESNIAPQAFVAMLVSDLGLPASAQAPILEQMTEQLAAYRPPPLPHYRQESRHVLRLDVRIGRVVVRDQFEWDLSDTSNNPDIFAERLCADLGLNTEHVPTVAQALREQLAELAHVQDKRQSCPVVTEDRAIRTSFDAWQPLVECLTVDEQEKLERKEKREARLQRRNRGKADLYGKPTSQIGRNRQSNRAAGRIGRRRPVARQPF